MKWFWCFQWPNVALVVFLLMWQCPLSRSDEKKLSYYRSTIISSSYSQLLTEPLKGIVVLHASGYASSNPRGSAWLRDTVFPTRHYTHVSINDFQIMDLLFQKLERQGTNKINGSDFTTPFLVPTVLVYNVENAGTDALYTLPRQLIDLYHRIPVLFNPSDEWKGWGKKYFYGEGTEVYPLATLVLREYGIYPYRDAQHPHSNVMQMPLNYPDGFCYPLVSCNATTQQDTAGVKNETRKYHLQHLRHSDSALYPWTTNNYSYFLRHNRDTERHTQFETLLRLEQSDAHLCRDTMGEHRLDNETHHHHLSGTDVMRHSLLFTSALRPFLWAFVGSVSGFNSGYRERRTVLDRYLPLYRPNYVSSDVPVENVLSLYRHAKFVLVMKGQVNLECFRATEAAMAGAIPIVVSEHNPVEMAQEYDFEGDPPPFLYFTEYDQAFQTITTMTEKEIDGRRENITRWFERRLSVMHHRIRQLAKQQHMDVFGHLRHLHKGG